MKTNSKTVRSFFLVALMTALPSPTLWAKDSSGEEEKPAQTKTQATTLGKIHLKLGGGWFSPGLDVNLPPLSLSESEKNRESKGSQLFERDAFLQLQPEFSVQLDSKAQTPHLLLHAHDLQFVVGSLSAHQSQSEDAHQKDRITTDSRWGQISLRLTRDDFIALNQTGLQLDLAQVGFEFVKSEGVALSGEVHAGVLVFGGRSTTEFKTGVLRVPLRVVTPLEDSAWLQAGAEVKLRVGDLKKTHFFIRAQAEGVSAGEQDDRMLQQTSVAAGVAFQKSEFALEKRARQFGDQKVEVLQLGASFRIE